MDRDPGSVRPGETGPPGGVTGGTPGGVDQPDLVVRAGEGGRGDRTTPGTGAGRPEMHDLLRMGVDGIIGDDPAELGRAVREQAGLTTMR